MKIKNQSFCKYNRLSVLQFSTESKNSFEYISGTKAVKDGLVKVTEISEAGSVNNLVVENPLDNYLFFSDGDILVGAKQNRVINISMLLEPKSKTIIPVSCVERGRWRHISHRFTSSDYIIPRGIRESKLRSLNMNLRDSGRFYASQHLVWDEVDMYYHKAGLHSSPTDDLNSGIDANKETFNEYLNHFKLDKESNGMAVFIDDNVVSIDIFNRDDIYVDYFPKLVQSVASETYYLKDKQFELSDEMAVQKTTDMLSKLDQQDYVVKNNPGVGILKSFSGDMLSGFMLNYENHLIHLAILNLLKDEKANDLRFRTRRIY